MFKSYACTLAYTPHSGESGHASGAQVQTAKARTHSAGEVAAHCADSAGACVCVFRLRGVCYLFVPSVHVCGSGCTCLA